MRLRRRNGLGHRYPALDRLAPEFERVAAALDASAKPPSQRRRRWRLQAGAGLVAIMGVSIALVALMVHSAGASDVRRSAAAAEKAGTFTFLSTSELTFSSGARQTARQTGAVDLNVPGYRLRISEGADGAGFERLVFPRTLFVRHVGRRHPGPWREVALSPPVEIAPKVGGSGGISDPLGLLAVLRDSNGARQIGHEEIEGISTTHFRLQTTLGRFLRDEGVTAPARLSSDLVTVDVWLDSASRVIRAQRLFDLGIQRGARLLVTTDFAGYGSIVGLHPPQHPLRSGVVERLNPVAADPLSASVLAALLNGSRHPATPTIEPSTR
jgi:hypothetical protein